MNRMALLCALVFLVAFPLAAQPSAQGSFTLAGPTLVSDGELDQEDPKQTILVPDFTMKVTVDCMSTLGTRVIMGGTVSDSNVRSMIGRVATLTVEDNDLNPKDPTDRFTFGSYWEKDISWFPSDAEVPGDAGWKMSWWATDAERRDDVGYMISRQRHVDCHSFPVATYDLAPIG